MPIIEPHELLDRFEPLLELYKKDSNGSAINVLIQDDWNVFASNDDGIQKKLLEIISSDTLLSKEKYKPKFSKDNENVQQWEKFREELKHNNRFFPKDAPIKKHIDPFGNYIGLKLKIGSQKFYRARVNNSNKPFQLNDLKKPPKKIATNGRANPLGIPYLYLSSTIKTAVSEVRGHKSEIVSVAEFQQIKDLELADLRDPKKTISPFELNSENELEVLYKYMPYLTLLGNELSKPIIPREANLEYLPTQYLCELLKQIGFHGIVFKSSITNGHNYVIFANRRLKVKKISQRRIVDIDTKSRIQR